MVGQQRECATLASRADAPCCMPQSATAASSGRARLGDRPRAPPRIQRAFGPRISAAMASAPRWQSS
eukprot:6795287-Pyramimonas_sp.AAC.1